MPRLGVYAQYIDRHVHPAALAPMSRPLRYLDDEETADNERAAFIRAAFDLLAGSDRVHLSVADVVARSGRHRASFYRLFGSKDGLILAMAQSAVHRTVDRLVERIAAADTDGDAVRAWATTLLGLAVPRHETRGVRALALDRFHLLHSFPDAEVLLTQPIVELLVPLVRPLPGHSGAVVAQSAYDLVMGRQSSWIAIGHTPTTGEIDDYARVVVTLTGHCDAASRNLP